MDPDLTTKCSFSACRKGMDKAPIYLSTRSIKYPSRQIGSTESDRWPTESQEYCSIICLSNAVREDMGVR